MNATLERSGWTRFVFVYLWHVSQYWIMGLHNASMFLSGDEFEGEFE